MENYHSQLGQDNFIDNFYNKKEGGVFIDVGAHDGISISNTYFLEKNRNWKGICIEPQPEIFNSLKENRSSININCAVSNYNGETDFTYIEGYSNMLSGLSSDYNDSHRMRIANEVNSFGGKVNNIKVPVKKLQDILDEYEIYEIDFCSIDTEGSELSIVESIDFDKTNINVFIIENNYQETKIKDFLENKGYYLHSKINWDDVFVKSKNI